MDVHYIITVVIPTLTTIITLISIYIDKGPLPIIVSIIIFIFSLSFALFGPAENKTYATKETTSVAIQIETTKNYTNTTTQSSTACTCSNCK